MDLGFGLLRLGGVVIGLFQRLVGHRRLGHLIELRLHQKLFVVIGELVGEILGLVELFGLRLLRDEGAVDQEIEDIGFARLALDLLRQARPEILGRDLQIFIR